MEHAFERILVGIALGFVSSGCALEVAQSESAQNALHGGEDEAAVSDWVSPLDGEPFEGGLNAVVPVHGLTRVPDQSLHVLVYNHVQERWVELGAVQSGSEPVGRAADTGEPLYAYDFGTLCLSGCTLTAPLHAWAGLGPFELDLRVVTDQLGGLPAYPWDACAGVLEDDDATATCAPLTAPVVTVSAAPLHHH